MEEEEKEIGVITHVDGKKVSEITREDRKRWAKKLCRELETLDGIDSVVIGASTQTPQEIVLVVGVEASKNRRGKFDIEPNLRSLGQRMMHTIRNDEYVSMNIVEPQIIERPEKDGDLYNRATYRVGISYP